MGGTCSIGLSTYELLQPLPLGAASFFEAGEPTLANRFLFRARPGFDLNWKVPLLGGCETLTPGANGEPQSMAICAGSGGVPHAQNRLMPCRHVFCAERILNDQESVVLELPPLGQGKTRRWASEWAH